MAVSRKLTRLTRFAQKLSTTSGAVKIIRLALEGEEKFLADLNRQQLLDSEKSDDSRIMNLQTGSLLHAKKRRAYTLKDKGAFHRSITARLAPRSIIITATDSKTESLQQTFGKEILGLGTDAKRDVMFKLKKTLPQLIRRQL